LIGFVNNRRVIDKKDFFKAGNSKNRITGYFFVFYNEHERWKRKIFRRIIHERDT